MSSPKPVSPGSPMPLGLKLPDIIVTRRTRTLSMNGRIEDEYREGIVKFFCRSKGHGFIDDDEQSQTVPVFMHISDIEGEYIPRKGDRVRFRTCPMPPRFDKPQAVDIQIIDFTPEIHHKWCDKETDQELLEDQMAIKEEAKMHAVLANDKTQSPLRRMSSSFETVHESNNETQAADS